MAFSRRRRLSSRALVPGRYLTDGRRLLRVVSKFDDGRSVMALLEDCSTLDAVAYALVELRSMGFQRVRVISAVPGTEPPPPSAGQTAERPAAQAADQAAGQAAV
jgi:hypothetical protein